MIFILRHFELRFKNIFLSLQSKFGKRNDAHPSEASFQNLVLCK